MRASPRGLTLVEVLIAAGLAGLLLTILVQLLVPGLRIWRHTQAMSEIEQNAMIAEARIELALLNTTPESITVIDRPDRQAFSCMDNEGDEDEPGYDQNADIVWHSMVMFSLNPGERVLRQHRHSLTSNPTEPYAFTESELDDAINGAPGQMVASKVVSLKLLPPPTEQKLWQVQMTLENDTPRGPRQIHRELNVVPRIQSL